MVTVVSPQVDGNDHVNNFAMCTVRSLVQCSARTLSSRMVVGACPPV